MRDEADDGGYDHGETGAGGLHCEAAQFVGVCHRAVRIRERERERKKERTRESEKEREGERRREMEREGKKESEKERKKQLDSVVSITYQYCSCTDS